MTLELWQILGITFLLGVSVGVWLGRSVDRQR